MLAMQGECGCTVILRSTWGEAVILGGTAMLGSTGFVGDEDLLTLQETCVLIRDVGQM